MSARKSILERDFILSWGFGTATALLAILDAVAWIVTFNGAPAAINAALGIAVPLVVVAIAFVCVIPKERRWSRGDYR